MAEDQERGGQDVNQELRRILNDAYAAVVGRQASQAFGAVTYEELAQQQNDRIEGRGTRIRPNELERIDRIERDLTDLIQQVRAVPPERFVLRNPDRDVNTTPEGEDE